jgi:hypothetical protein
MADAGYRQVRPAFSSSTVEHDPAIDSRASIRRNCDVIAPPVDVAAPLVVPSICEGDEPSAPGKLASQVTPTVDSGGEFLGYPGEESHNHRKQDDDA